MLRKAAQIGLDELVDVAGSKFRAVKAVVARVKQLRNGEPRKIETESTNFVEIALEEISSNKIDIDQLLSEV